MIHMQTHTLEERNQYTVHAHKGTSAHVHNWEQKPPLCLLHLTVYRGKGIKDVRLLFLENKDNNE